MQKKNRKWLIAVIIAVLLCCLLIALGLLGAWYFRTNQKGAGPTVYFHTPDDGNVLEAGGLEVIHIVATDPIKISKVEFWVNGELLATKKSSLQKGISPFPFVTDWTPPEAGEYSLIARAYNTAGGRAYSEIKVNVGDAMALAGPDGDDDGYPDDMDECPEVAGVAPDGCPVERQDADGDGVEDALDECPDVPGAFVSEGCPDRDLDGVPDEQDVCPDEVGAAESGAGVGCPDVSAEDRDGDGVADSVDACPDEPGAVVNEGCPAGADAPSGGGDGGDDAATIDSDGDGLIDEADACPFEAGPLENNGCPADEDGGIAAPGDEGDADGDGIADGEEGSEGIFEALDFLFGGIQITNFVEFQALDFQVNEEYDEVYCYASLTQDPPDHYGPFNFEGERYWDITEYMGSIMVGVSAGESIAGDGRMLWVQRSAWQQRFSLYRALHRNTPRG